MKTGRAARKFHGATSAPFGSVRSWAWRRAEAYDSRHAMGTIRNFSLVVLMLAGAVYLLLPYTKLHDPSAKHFILSLSGPGLSPHFTLPLRYLYITLTPDFHGSTNKSSDGASGWYQSWWWGKEDVDRFKREESRFSGSLSTVPSRGAPAIPLDSKKWKVIWWLKPSPPPSSRLERRHAISQVVDRGDGVYILRFQLMESVPKGYTLGATILHSGEVDLQKHIAGQSSAYPFPAQLKVVPQTFQLEGPVYAPDSCPCTSTKGNDGWLEALQCPETFNQLTEDLSRFPVVDLHRLREEARQLVGPQSLRTLVHYVVKNNQLYRRTLGPLPGFQHFSDAAFSYLTSVVNLPDVEFFFNLGDWPVERLNSAGRKALPLFGWSGGKNYADIVLPQWDVVKTTLFGLAEGRKNDLLTVQENTSQPLQKRIPKAVFRGRDSHPARVGAARLAKQFPSLLDVKITSWEKDENAAAEKELGGGPQAHIPLERFADYKYQLLLDGTVAAYRTPYLLHKFTGVRLEISADTTAQTSRIVIAYDKDLSFWGHLFPFSGGSVPLKHESEYYEWFYADLKPMQHFIPFKTDLSDLVQQLQWAEAHPTEAEAIARNAQGYARENLTPENVVCYYYRALLAYARRQNSEPRVYDDMIRVELGPRDAGCSCSSSSIQASHRNTGSSYPIVPVYPDNAGKIFKNAEKDVILAAFSSFCNLSGLYMPKFLRLARLFTAKGAPLVFGAADGYRYRYPTAYAFCNFPGAQPKVMFLRRTREQHSRNDNANGINAEKIKPEFMKGPLTLYDTVNFVNRYLPTTYHVHVPEDPLDEMSQPLPTDNDQKLIKTVVGANFDALVLNEMKDVLLFVHAPWCGLCKRFESTYEAFAEVVRASALSKTLIIAKLNGAENRLRYKEFFWSTYPVLWYVSGSSAAQRMRPAQFFGPWTTAGLGKFVQTHATAAENKRKTDGLP